MHLYLLSLINYNFLDFVIRDNALLFLRVQQDESGILSSSTTDSCNVHHHVYLEVYYYAPALTGGALSDAFV